MNQFYVYGHYENNNYPFYIGKGSGKRAYDHLYPSQLEKETLFYQKLREMISKSNLPIIKIIKDNLTEKEALDLEEQLIIKYGRIIDGGLLYNISKRGCEFTDESKLKISIALATREISTNTRIKRSIINTKRIYPKETRLKMRKRKNCISICSYNLLTNKVIKYYPSISSVKFDGYSAGGIYRVLKKRSSHHALLGWRELTEEESSLLSDFNEPFEAKKMPLPNEPPYFDVYPDEPYQKVDPPPNPMNPPMFPEEKAMYEGSEGPAYAPPDSNTNATWEDKSSMGSNSCNCCGEQMKMQVMGQKGIYCCTQCMLEAEGSMYQ